MSERVQRRLAAIVSTDIVGYSRLMEVDEADTLARMKAHRVELWTPLIEKFGGRVVGTAGDSLLVEYASAVSAVESAIEVQEGMVTREADQPDDRKMLLRVGINIGEVVVDGDDIFGDGVNIAARLEALADPGSICISGKVHDEIDGKLSAKFVDAGEHEVKNIARPVRVWKWDTDIKAPALVQAEALASQKPSIAVLAFNNMSGDPEQEYFSDGISEDIITALSRFRNFHVIARNSTFTYKGQSVDIKKVGQELNARYVLEGSVRKAGSRVRITAQLIEASTGNHVWAERYDRELIDIFELQDEITDTIATAISPAFESAELRRIRGKRSENLDSWDLTLKATQFVNRGTREDYERAREFAQQAIALDPHNAQALATLSWCHGWEVTTGYLASPDEAMAIGINAARRALEIDPSDAAALRSLSGHLLLSGAHHDAIEAAQRCVKENSNYANGWMVLGTVLAYAGRFDEAVEAIERGTLLNPRDPFMGMWTVQLSVGAFMARRYEEGVSYARRAATELPGYYGVYRAVAGNLVELGRMQEAAEAIAEVKRLAPDMTVARTRAGLKWAWDAETLDRYCAALARAGLPEE